MVNKERFEHGEHNEAACELLHLNGKFPDWTVTTAFYASLHFVTSKIFPFRYRPKTNSSELIFDTLEKWQNFKGFISNKKHELLTDLVYTYCKEIHARYERLLSSSWNARYHRHQHDQTIVQRAIADMKAI